MFYLISESFFKAFHSHPRKQRKCQQAGNSNDSSSHAIIIFGGTNPEVMISSLRHVLIFFSFSTHIIVLYCFINLCQD